MRTVFEKTNRDELLARIDSLDETNTAEWGKMNVYQMVRHCSLFEEWMLGKNDPVYKQTFIGRIFGRIVLNGMIKDDSPIKRNMPTTDDLKIKETTGDLASEKKKWIALVQDYGNYSNPVFVHDFFGKMTIEQIGIFAYKHTDHHLRQFAA